MWMKIGRFGIQGHLRNEMLHFIFRYLNDSISKILLLYQDQKKPRCPYYDLVECHSKRGHCAIANDEHDLNPCVDQENLLAP